jgi:hypothetical protein
MMVPTGVQLFDFETESAGPAGTSPQVLAGKAEKRKRREIALSAFCVNWSGAVIPLPSRKLPERCTDESQASFGVITAPLELVLTVGFRAAKTGSSLFLGKWKVTAKCRAAS